jgi:two-component system, NtrC family, nitrogen regulation response regulator NtrX
VEIDVPPLRERREDIPVLVGHFAGEAEALGVARRTIGEAALRTLVAHDWPGNVRELRNVVQRSLVVAEGDEVLASDLPPELLAGDAPLSLEAAAELDLPFAEARRRALLTFDRTFLRVAFERNGRNVSRTAAALGMHRQTLQKLLTRHGIDRPGQEIRENGEAAS